jgi:hypothetical protein
LRTNWRAAARTSSSVAGGSKLKRILMLRHIGPQDYGIKPDSRSYSFSQISQTPAWVVMLLFLCVLGASPGVLCPAGFFLIAALAKNCGRDLPRSNPLPA